LTATIYGKESFIQGALRKVNACQRNAAARRATLSDQRETDKNNLLIAFSFFETTIPVSLSVIAAASNFIQIWTLLYSTGNFRIGFAMLGARL
jgi:hypothetical protein